ncbi:MAG: MarC family protein [Calditrichia bacterium]
MISFLVLLNPFALFIYLNPVMNDLTQRDFFEVLGKATLISLVIFLLFSEFGTLIFKFLEINFESFRIFGGIVIFTMALIFIIQGKKSLITLRGSLDELASEIALPFMVGAGTISISIIIGERFSSVQSILIIISSMVINYIIIAILVYIKYSLSSVRVKIAFDKLMVYLLRVNGFFIGAIGISMTISGIRNLFFK